MLYASQKELTERIIFFALLGYGKWQPFWMVSLEIASCENRFDKILVEFPSDLLENFHFHIYFIFGMASVSYRGYPSRMNLKGLHLEISLI